LPKRGRTTSWASSGSFSSGIRWSCGRPEILVKSFRNEIFETLIVYSWIYLFRGLVGVIRSAGRLISPNHTVRNGPSKKPGCPKYLNLEFNPGRAKVAAGRKRLGSRPRGGMKAMAERAAGTPQASATMPWRVIPNPPVPRANPTISPESRPNRPGSRS
jgi:hypothetical protein